MSATLDLNPSSPQQQQQQRKLLGVGLIEARTALEDLVCSLATTGASA